MFSIKPGIRSLNGEHEGSAISLRATKRQTMTGNSLHLVMSSKHNTALKLEASSSFCKRTAAETPLNDTRSSKPPRKQPMKTNVPRKPLQSRDPAIVKAPKRLKEVEGTAKSAYDVDLMDNIIYMGLINKVDMVCLSPVEYGV